MMSEVFDEKRLGKMMLQAAELYDEFGEEMRPILDRVEREYLAVKNKTSEADRIKKMLAA